MSVDHAQTEMKNKDTIEAPPNHMYNVYRQHICQTTTKQPPLADKMHASVWKSCTAWREHELYLGVKTHFLLVFFAFALFFLAWIARTVRRNQWQIIFPLCGWRLISSWRLGQKRRHRLRFRLPPPHHTDHKLCHNALKYIMYATKCV